ncbi:hypothetical protein BZA77DRAFT_323863 [Pyronema omphalodes]|nr:hypothetical protein BZA77DRAFT_323863 [Pyronema omphalodes]
MTKLELRLGEEQASTKSSWITDFVFVFLFFCLFDFYFSVDSRRFFFIFLVCFFLALFFSASCFFSLALVFS